MHGKCAYVHEGKIKCLFDLNVAQKSYFSLLGSQAHLNLMGKIIHHTNTFIYVWIRSVLHVNQGGRKKYGFRQPGIRNIRRQIRFIEYNAKCRNK
jgi:hypothetical protein